MKRARPSSAPRQLMMSLDTRAIEGLAERERMEAVRLLAQLLLEACGVVREEDGDEDV